MIISNRRWLSQRTGLKRTFVNQADIEPGEFEQFEPDSNIELGAALKYYGYFNSINVVNQSNSDVDIELDMNLGRKIPVPAKSSTSVDSIIYNAFNIRNVGTTTVSAGTVKVMVIWERPLDREGF